MHWQVARYHIVEGHALLNSQLANGLVLNTSAGVPLVVRAVAAGLYLSVALH